MLRTQNTSGNSHLTPSWKLSTAPRKIIELVTNVGDATLSAKPSPSEWSAKEVIGHIIETEVIFVRQVEEMRRGWRPGERRFHYPICALFRSE